MTTCYLDKDELDNAQKIITEAEKFTKRLMLLYFALGNYYLKKDRTDEAVTILEQGLDIARTPGDPYESLLSDYGKMLIPEVLYALAAEYLLKYEDEKAGRYLNDAVRLNNNRLNLRWDIFNEERVYASRIKPKEN
jgi:tetratricopeptide (TPR) repeat protein